MKAIAIILLLISSVAYGEIIPSSRRVDWAGNVGVPGGIPLNRTVYPNTLTANSTAAQIKAAIDATPVDRVCLIPAGTHNISTTAISIQKGITLRGTVINGTNATTLRGVANANGFQGLIYVGTLPGGKWVKNLYSGGLKGSTNVTLAGSAGSNLKVGMIAVIDQTNDVGLVYGSGVGGSKEDDRGGGSKLYWMHQQVEIKRVVPNTGNTNFDIWPPLVWNFTNHASLFVRTNAGTTPNFVSYAGIEDLIVQNTGTTGSGGGAQNNLAFTGTRYCWLKNVRSVDGYGDHLWAQNNFGLEVRGCYFTGSLWNSSGGGGYGLIFENDHSDLIEDNILVGIRDFIKFGLGASGNVALYNYLTNSIPNPSYPTDVNKSGIAHSSHPMMNLFEGNVCYVPTIDQYFGGGSHFTLFRNWFRGPMAYALIHPAALKIEMHEFYNNVAGNILGAPRIYQYANRSSLLLSPSAFTATDYHTVQFGYYDIDGGDARSNDASTQWANTIYAGNYDFVVTNQTWSNGVSSQTISNSYYYAAAPHYFGTNFTWPPFNPATNALRYGETNIPAGWRYTYGTNRPYGQLAVSANSLDWGVLTATTNNFPKSVTFSNIGTAPIALTWVNPPTFQVVFQNQSNYIAAGSSVSMNIDYLMEHRGFAQSGLVQREDIVFTGGGGFTLRCKAVTTYDPIASGNFTLALLNAGVTNDFQVTSDKLSASGNTIPFIPGQSGEAYFGFTLTNLSVVNLFGSVQATNAVNSFAVEVDGEPVYPKSVWDVPATGAGFVTNYMMFRGLGTASKPTGKQWLLQAGTHYVKIYSQTANTKIAKVIVDVRPIIQQVQSAGVGAGGITSQ